jgi:flagellar hook-length control protein FliK
MDGSGSRVDFALAMRPDGAPRLAGTESLSFTAPAGTEPGPGSRLPGHPLPTAAGPLPPLPAFGDRTPWSRALGDRLLGLSDQGVQSARLRLYPEYLGELDVRIQVEDGRAQVWFSASQAQAREAIEAALPKLRELFAESGLELLRAQVDSGSGRQGSGGFRDDGPATPPGWRAEPAGGPLPAASLRPPLPGVAGHASRRVDVLA